jgi:predicted dehydrogenase
MALRTVGIVMNGVTGRMGYNQHLVRSVLAIRDAGGIPAADGDDIWPEPVLVGRDPEKLRRIAKRHGLDRWSTDLDTALAGDDIEIYFDAQSTSLHEAGLRKAIAAGKHVYCEKPVAESLTSALELAHLADAAGVKSGVVQDKLFLPGIRKLKRLIDGGFFGRILSLRGEFGYWVFEGDWQLAQRPSWNYRREDAGGITTDMFCHWQYLLENLLGTVRSVQALAVTHVPERIDEDGHPYSCTADDAAYATFELDGGIVAQINSSWTVRVHRDELLELQVDGTQGSAVAGLRHCRVQHRAMTPKPAWNPDLPATDDFRAGWAEVPDNQSFENGFREQWEMFLRHVIDDAPWRWDLLAGARGVQLAELGLQSAAEGRRITVPSLERSAA